MRSPVPDPGRPGEPDPLAALAELPGVAAAVQDARDAVDRLRGHRVMRRQSETVTAESLRRGATAAASLETGVDASVEPGSTSIAARGADRAYGELGAVRDTWARSPLQVLARLHLLAARGVLGVDQLGRPRGAATEVRPGPYDEWLGRAPGPEVVAERLDALVDVLAATRAPALVVAAAVHAEIVTLRPFAWGNHVVALAAQRLVLVERGLDPRSQAVVEVGHQVGAYGPALGAYASGGAAGVAEWVRHCGAAVSAGAVESLAICEALGR